VGKKELQAQNRKRFVEFYVPELVDPVELEKIVVNRSKLQFKQIESELITQVYLKLRELTEGH
jgi:midasin (ATPase involved in ribosome maturation)